MNKPIDSLKAYTEACNTLRHYSNASLSVKITSVVQGIALLIAWVYVLTRGDPKYAVTVPIIGFLFTGLLYLFNKAYFQATENFYIYVAQMEEKFFDKDCRPFTNHLKFYNEKYNNLWRFFFVTNVTFTLIGSLFFLAFLISLFKVIY